MTATQDDMIAELQRANAGLRQRLAERDVALAERNSDYDERIAHQAATIDVLREMAASPGDPQPVFDLIVRRAAESCRSPSVVLMEYGGGMMHWRSIVGEDLFPSPAALEAYKRRFPIPPTRESVAGRSILSGSIIHVPNTDEDNELGPVQRALGMKSRLAVPLMRNGKAVGVIGLDHFEPGAFTESQITLLSTFAEQAVIAIGSAETYRALQDRTADLQESLEYQTATSDVLKVISRSTFDLQPVLDTVVEAAARLCEAEMVSINRRDGDLCWAAANYGYPPEIWAHWVANGPFRLDPDAVTVGARTLLEGRVVHVHDVAAVPGYPAEHITLGKQRTTLGVPLLRGGEVIGNIGLARQRVEPFSERQIALLENFADQAVIAIENTRLITEQQEALEQQTATSEVLQVINASPGDLAPVFDAVVEKAMRLCGAAFGGLMLLEGDCFKAVALAGVPSAYAEFCLHSPDYGRAGPESAPGRILAGANVVEIEDLMDAPAYRDGNPARRALVDLGAARSLLGVALRKDNTLLGAITIYRQEVRRFSVRQIALLENFAAQAVIAMENARLINEQREALEQQTATAEVLQVINASPGDLAPVFKVILDKAHSLCDAVIGSLLLYDGEFFRAAATHGHPESFAAFVRQPFRPNQFLLPLLHGERIVHVPDFKAAVGQLDHALTRGTVESTGVRTSLWVPLRKDNVVLGCISAFRQAVRPFSEKEIVLLENFAAQAVVAMENARLLDEIRRRQEELRITFENMGDGVAMFDGAQNLVAWNRKFQDILEVPDDIIAQQRSLPDYVRYLAERGEFGTDADVDEQVRRVLQTTGQTRVFERVRPNGSVIEVHSNPIAGGGFVLIYSDITERKRNEEAIRAARDAAEEASRTIEAAFRDLKLAQANLIQAEKMASLGQLTAGIAHEIKNPLNFVNNFAALSVDLLSELKETAAPGFAALTDAQRTEIDDLSAMLTSNLEKITEHGKRADGIVKAMLEHSRGASGERRTVDINALADEALNLAYHGARAQDQSFNITLERDFEAGIAPIEVNPQDMTRVLLNLFSNGFYAANKHERSGAHDFGPLLKLTTRAVGDDVEIRVRDNGAGIPDEIRDKLFQPFFTTKPTGEGTGLGLSITYDIVTKAHGGTISVESDVGAFTEFVVTLPRRMFSGEGERHNGSSADRR